MTQSKNDKKTAEQFVTWKKGRSTEKKKGGRSPSPSLMNVKAQKNVTGMHSNKGNSESSTLASSRSMLTKKTRDNGNERVNITNRRQRGSSSKAMLNDEGGSNRRPEG